MLRDAKRSAVGVHILARITGVLFQVTAVIIANETCIVSEIHLRTKNKILSGDLYTSRDYHCYVIHVLSGSTRVHAHVTTTAKILPIISGAVKLEGLLEISG